MYIFEHCIYCGFVKGDRHKGKQDYALLIELGIVWILSIPIPILLVDSYSYQFSDFDSNVVKKVNHLDIKHIYFVSLFAKHLIAAEYHE